MRRTPAPRLTLARLVRRADARRAALAALALAGPAAVAQQPVPQGGEFRVNTYTLGAQTGSSVAMDADGDFVVVWQSEYLYEDIYAQRYTSSGEAVGANFLVNPATVARPGSPSVAMDADGDFVVAWASARNRYSDDFDVYAQRYDAAGVPLGEEFRVNTYTTDFQNSPAVAMDADGDFVVAWLGDGQDGPSLGIRAQRYAASGSAVGAEFRVNATTTSAKNVPAVAMDADGDFVVAWASDEQDGASDGIYAQRYDADGGAQAPEFRVNTYTTGSQFYPSVAMNADGDLVVAWQSTGQDGAGNGVYVQRYAASGAPVGGEVRVNAFTAGSQSVPSVALDADGEFVVAWQSGGYSGAGQDGDRYGVYAQRYTAAGVARGGEFRVNTYTTDSQSFPSVAMDADGDFVVAWQSGLLNIDGQDGSAEGVYAQRYAAGPVASEPGTTAGLTLALVPSPVGPSGGRVRYETPGPGHVRVTVSDVLGREVAVLVDGEQAAGPHTVALDAGRLAPGVYVVRLDADASTVVRRVTVAR